MTTLVKPKLASVRMQAASEYRIAGRQERAIGSNGEVNAGSKRDLLTANMAIAEAAGRGEVGTDRTVQGRELQRSAMQARRELLRAAMTDPNARRVLGEAVAREIYMTTNRKGISRRFLNQIELKTGELPRFPVRQKNVTAFYLSGSSRIETQLVTDKWLTPLEGQIATRVFVPQNELNQSNSDVLEEKAVEALEAVMVTEDRYWYNLARATIGTDNNQQIVSGTLSPQSLMAVRQQVARWGLKAAFCYMASDLFVDIVGDSSFIQAIEPVARHELVMTGEMAILYGMTLISEAYRHPEHKVLGEGEFFVVSDPSTHGAYSDRGGVDSRPLDGVSENIIGAGWLFAESWSAAIGNSRSVVAAVRV
jgi:hypothetical protein